MATGGQPIRSHPTSIAGMAVPQDDVSVATWQRVQRSLPRYLLAHSIRTFCWGVEIGAGEGWPIDRQVLWTASLLHDQALTTIRTNPDCFEVAGAARARHWLERAGMTAERAMRVERAIVLHMQPSVTLDDGIEAVLLDRATSVDVRGHGYDLVDAVRARVVLEYPRGDFDRQFLAAIRREVAIRDDCQSARLLHTTGLADWMARSPWARDAPNT